MNSVVRTYKQNGYITIGIHTNTETFYNRKNVYTYLGFEQTVFSQDIDNPEIKGGNISDNEFANQVIKKFEENSGNKYIFGVTMQNHMPYGSERYDEFDVDIHFNNTIDSSDQLKLRNYIQGIYDSDQMYIKLVNYLKNVKEPTILIMFGDHLPALKSIYQQSNYTYLDYYTTPYVIWANYDIDISDIPEYVSPSNLSIKIMRVANVEIPWYLKKIEELYQFFPAINNQLVMTNEGEILTTEEIVDYDLVNDCRILQYDLLIKKKYIPVK